MLDGQKERIMDEAKNRVARLVERIDGNYDNAIPPIQLENCPIGFQQHSRKNGYLRSFDLFCTFGSQYGHRILELYRWITQLGIILHSAYL